ncbi:MAG: DUF2795 domain-containing protein [Myxococcota bacterium]
MAELHVPSTPLPWFLVGLPFPSTPADAVEHARGRGAPDVLLDILESLPAAVFTSEAGLHHALSGLDGRALQGIHPPPTYPSHDGTTS